MLITKTIPYMILMRKNGYAIRQISEETGFSYDVVRQVVATNT